MSKISVVLTGLLVVVVLLLVGYFLLIFRNPLILEKPSRLFKPDVEILNTTAEEEIFPGFDYGFVITSTLNNKGASGTILVKAKLLRGTKSWVKKQAVYIANGETKEISFKFDEPEFRVFGSDKTMYNITILGFK